MYCDDCMSVNTVLHACLGLESGVIEVGLPKKVSAGHTPHISPTPLCTVGVGNTNG